MLEKEKSYKVVGAISDGATVVRECLRLRPDVVLWISPWALLMGKGNDSHSELRAKLRIP
jgi:hypothetical protein